MIVGSAILFAVVAGVPLCHVKVVPAGRVLPIENAVLRLTLVTGQIFEIVSGVQDIIVTSTLSAGL